MSKAGDMANATMEGMNSTVNKAKDKFMEMLKNKNKWGALFLGLVIIFLVWILSLYIRGQLKKKRTNNEEMTAVYDEVGVELDGINDTNPNHKYLLRDYYVASSYNSCCGGTSEKDYVDKVPLKLVIKQGARLLDFEVYSKDGKPIIAAGPGPNNGKYCLKGTYNHMKFNSTMTYVKKLAFDGANAPNPNDPLFLSFRVKTNNPGIYDIMADTITREFGKNLLGPQYSHNGKFNKSGKDVITNIPLLNLRNKVIIIIQDPTNNYRETKFEEIVNMSGKGNDGNGLPFVSFYKDKEIVETFDAEDLKEKNKKFVGITMPDFSKTKNNSVAPIHHQYGIQFVMMNYSNYDENMEYYRKFFNERGTAFRLKPQHLRYIERKIPPPKPQRKELGYGPRQSSYLGGAFNPSL